MKKIILSLLLMTAFFNNGNAQTSPADSLQAYTGKYKFPDGSVVTEVTVTADNGILMAASAMGNSELRRQEGDVFEIVSFAGTATFRRNGDGKITGVQIIVGDVNIEGTKTEGITIIPNRSAWHSPLTIQH